jgi:hypothetical protein
MNTKNIHPRKGGTDGRPEYTGLIPARAGQIGRTGRLYLRRWVDPRKGGTDRYHEARYCYAAGAKRGMFKPSEQALCVCLRVS